MQQLELVALLEGVDLGDKPIEPVGRIKAVRYHSDDLTEHLTAEQWQELRATQERLKARAVRIERRDLVGSDQLGIAGKVHVI